MTTPLNKGIIYSYRNMINNKRYIGQTIKPEQRKKAHLFNARRGVETKFYNAIRKYGIESFYYEILEETDQLLLNEREIYWIKEYDSFKNGYNMNLGGSSVMSGRKHTQEWKDNMRMRFSGENSHHFGKKKTKEHVAALRRSQMKYAKSVIRLNKNGEYIDEFETLSDAAIAVNGNKGNISSVCLNKPGFITAYGYKWQFKNK